jgi:uncharacterized membrane protein
MFFHQKRALINLGNLDSQSFSKFINGLGEVPLLAHHPACKYHGNHLIWIGKIPLCLGCAMMTSGIMMGLLLIPYLGIFRTLPFSVLLFLGVLLYIPSLLQIWIQQKRYKILSRFCLGISIVLLCYSGLWLTPNSVTGWLLKIGFIITFYVVWNLTLQIRSQYAKSPCKNCPEGRFPLCAYTTERIAPLAHQYFLESDRSNLEADEFVKALQSLYAKQ